MAESSDQAHFDTLQVAPTAEPEVIAAAYRALAKKYHPDHSNAPDAMVRMSRINAAFQAVRGRSARVTSSDSQLPTPSSSPTRLSHERVDPSSSLEEMLAAVGRKMAAARQHLIDEIIGDGVPRDVATNLVSTVLRSPTPNAADSRKERSGKGGGGFDPNASYDDALRAVMQRAQTVRDQVADEMVRDGLSRGAALELADMAFERVRKKTGSAGNAEVRLTPDRVDLSGPLDSGVRVVAAKLLAARRMVVEELARDGIPMRTAEQLVDSASQSPQARPPR